MAQDQVSQDRVWLDEGDCDLAEFRAQVEQETDLADFPTADAVEQNVLVYGERLQQTAAGDGRRAVQAELVRALTDGPGVVVFRGAFPDGSVVDRVTAVFEAIIADEQAAGGPAGDHFATPGTNDRIWEALGKLARRDPGAFADYYANDVIALVSEAWLGAGYQVTSQPNVVRPGGQAQVAHRDYHLGFMSQQQALGYPAHVHRLSPTLTLQGAVAHCDMPLATGPTMYLPHSHRYLAGYAAYHRPEFTAYFDEHFVQLPLKKGDAAFLNPAVFHGAGTNLTSDVRRIANLLQMSSAFGRAMDNVDRAALSKAVFPALLERAAAGERALRNVVAATAEGYAFPTNLDRDQPSDAMAPQTQADLLWRAVREGRSEEALAKELDTQAHRRTPA